MKHPQAPRRDFFTMLNLAFKRRDELERENRQLKQRIAELEVELLLLSLRFPEIELPEQ